MKISELLNSNELKENITLEVRSFIKDYAEGPDVFVQWGSPQVGFADVSHPSIQALKEVVSHSHAMPEDVLKGATIVIACYVPFTRELAKENTSAGRLASPEWALAYEQTNEMFGFLNAHLIQYLDELGYQSAVSKEALTFDRDALISNWSHRHIAFAAGLGTFGLNNMLITKSGCCGRYTTLVTNLDVDPDLPMEKELCLFKKDGSCGICMKKCPMEALSVSGYDRQKCYSLLTENAQIYTQFGSSYTEAGSGNDNTVGSEVCGKCITAAPCAFWQIK